MKPEVKKALDLIIQATGMLQLTRENHFQIQQSLTIIEAELNQKNDEKKDKS